MCAQKPVHSLLPLIRVYRGKPSNADKYYDLSYFVEPEGRTYDSWNDFIEHNQLPECKICYPSGGWYAPGENGYCLIAFSTSAECDTSRILANVGDILTTIAGVGATVVGIVGLFTPLAPLAATALAATAITTGAYGAGRGTYQLVDRATHGQSINPFDNKQSFFCWFSLIGSGFALGSSFGISYAASAGAAGRHVGQSMRIAINTAIIGSVTTNGFAIATGIFNVVDRFGQGDVPVLELFQLTASILFFTNTAVSMKMASTLVKNAQRAKLGNTRTLLHTDDQKLNFDMKILTDRNKALAGGNVKTGEMHGAEVTIARLNKLMVNSNWQNDFGHSNIGVSAQRHTSHPTHLANNAGIILQEAAENLAKQNQRTRFGGSQVGRQSESTIFAIPPHELDASLKNVVLV
uniref:DUF4781 domain-containing protein n=1 Tax=Panagrolaimus superbus TaxID=310955 RepID=A0A914XUW8_9BILA